MQVSSKTRVRHHVAFPNIGIVTINHFWINKSHFYSGSFLTDCTQMAQNLNSVTNLTVSTSLSSFPGSAAVSAKVSAKALVKLSSDPGSASVSVQLHSQFSSSLSYCFSQKLSSELRAQASLSSAPVSDQLQSQLSSYHSSIPKLAKFFFSSVSNFAPFSA